MKRPPGDLIEDESGIAIVAVTIVMVAAMILFGAVILRVNHPILMARKTEYNVRADLLARSGLEKAIVEMRANPTGYAGTPLTWEKDSPSMGRAYWVEQPVRRGNQVELIATGISNGVAREIRAFAAMASGPSGVFDKAIYAGNVPPDGRSPALDYELRFGGIGDQADQINGDIYCGNNVSVMDDSIVLPAVAEPYADLNGNGMYDKGDTLIIDIDGNRQYDPDISERLYEDNGNGIHEPELGETFDDVNGNGWYDRAETFQDRNQNGLFDVAEPFTDRNGNGRYDYGIEAVGEVDYPAYPDADGGADPLYPPNLGDADFPNTAEVNVAERFTRIGSGTLPESDAAHIFRKNSGSAFGDVDEVFIVKGRQINPDDYFLEDPYEPVSAGDRQSDSGATEISISSSADKCEEGNNKVYFIDGNLWLHNTRTYSFRLKYPEDEGVHLTFVVRGNIVFCDNFFYGNVSKDQVAFIAMRRDDDPQGIVSGNIHIGHPQFGTVRYLHGVLYAENNLCENNLNEGRSHQFDMYGSMGAGNHITINRNYNVPGHYERRSKNGKWRKIWIEGEEKHSRMVLSFDGRYSEGPNGFERLCPGLPRGPNRAAIPVLRIGSVVYSGHVEPPGEYWRQFYEARQGG